MRTLPIGLLILIAGSLAAQEDVRFPADAVVDVSLPPYAARPDDGIDDTVALQRAISDNVETGRFIYLPAGTYLLSDTLVARNRDGMWRAQLTLQGQGRGRTILKLADKAPGFGDPDRPKAMLMTGSHHSPGDGPSGGGNKAFRNNLFDLSVDVGRGNAGAIGVEWAVSNHGAIRRVAISAADRAAAGIALRRNIPGPGLIADVHITGFDVGMDYGDVQYGVTIDGLRLADQHVAGLRIADNLMHVRRLESRNRVPAVLVTGRSGGLTLLDSTLSGGDPAGLAVDCAGNLLMQQVAIDGYRASAVRVRGVEHPGRIFAELAAPGALGAPAGAGSGLPVEEFPAFHNNDLADWQAVGERLPGEADDTAAIQRAIDAGKGTVYLRNDRVRYISDTIVIRGAVRQVLGFGTEINLGAAGAPFSDIARPRPLVRIDPTVGETVFLDHLFVNAQYPGEVIFENNTAKTVVIRHCGGWVGSGGHAHAYRNTAAATGRVFIEDVFLPGWEFRGQTVWARQFNPENWEGDGSEAQVTNSGSRLWILGFKTEGPAPFLATLAGGTTELLGAYNYVSATKLDPLPVDAVPYIVDHATAFLGFTCENFRASDYRVYIRERDASGERTWGAERLPPRNGTPGDRSLAVPAWRSGGSP